jgi:hypothetical protein
VIQKILSPVSVLSFFNHKKRVFEPLIIFWEGKKHKVQKVGYHHKVREGTTLFHIFSILCETLFFRLKLDTESLLWIVEEISDGEVN